VPKVSYTRQDGTATVVEGRPGDSVMMTAVRLGVGGIVGQCGGMLSCASCHVFLDETELDRYPPVSEMEDEMLDCAASEREDNSRLSCQLILEDGVDVHVTLPAAQL
jgi:2Fe-2S ferredoxin